MRHARTGAGANLSGMRRVPSFIALFALLLSPVRTIAQDAATVLVTAQQIAFYADRGVLVADGGVSVRFGGHTIAATRAAYDLRTNVLSATGVDGGGYAYDFRANRGGAAQQVKIPELSIAEASALAQQVEIRPAASLTFTNAQVRVGGQLQSAASYEYAIPSPRAKDFGYSPVPAAALDWPVLLSSGSNAYAFTRLRYDRYNGGPGLGFEEHFARSDRGYLALGQTADVDAARFDLLAFQRISDRLTQSLSGVDLPGDVYARYSLSEDGRRGFASLSFSQINGTRSDDLYLSTNAHPFGHVGSLRYQADLGHDVHPYDYSGSQDVRLTPGAHLDTTALAIHGTSISSSIDLGESLYDYGRGTLASTLSFWASRPASARLFLNGGATFSHDAPPFPSTYRTYLIGSTYEPSKRFRLISSLTYAHDVPQYAGFGRPEFAAAFDVRILRKRGDGVEIGAIAPFGTVGQLARAGVFNLRFIRE
jgi:hypothetical protein